MIPKYVWCCWCHQQATGMMWTLRKHYLINEMKNNRSYHPFAQKQYIYSSVLQHKYIRSLNFLSLGTKHTGKYGLEKDCYICCMHWSEEEKYRPLTMMTQNKSHRVSAEILDIKLTWLNSEMCCCCPIITKHQNQDNNWKPTLRMMWLWCDMWFHM